MMINLLIEYVGGPRDGQRSYLMRGSSKVPLAYPIEIAVIKHDPEDATETRIGKYVRGELTADEAAMRYVWTYHA